MRVLIDTNVLLDFLAVREPFAADAVRILDACDKKVVTGMVAAHSITDMFYILRKNMTTAERREALTALCRILTVQQLDEKLLMNALEDGCFEDFEDCIQYHSAKKADADFIITRNKDDFRNSEISVVSPHEFCESELSRQKTVE